MDEAQCNGGWMRLNVMGQRKPDQLDKGEQTGCGVSGEPGRWRRERRGRMGRVMGERAGSGNGFCRGSCRSMCFYL